MSVKTLRLLCIGRISVFACVLILFFIIPTGFIEGGPTVCVFKILLGIECPGCGMTRAFSCILHGDLVSAISYNRLVVVVFPLFCFILLKNIVSLFIPSPKSFSLQPAKPLFIGSNPITASNNFKELTSMVNSFSIYRYDFATICLKNGIS